MDFIKKYFPKTKLELKLWISRKISFKDQQSFIYAFYAILRTKEALILDLRKYFSRNKLILTFVDFFKYFPGIKRDLFGDLKKCIFKDQGRDHERLCSKF